MPTVIFRPELENPPRASEVNISFTVSSAGSQFNVLTLESGLNRNVPTEDWEIVSQTEPVKALMKLNAIQVLGEKGETPPAKPSSVGDLLGLEVTEALKAVETSFDEKFLTQWKDQEGRTRIINAINLRLKNIRDGKG